ncbi:hypothetical protein D6789_00025 [Candidatus Woesearchaeota archaeon]|nr:MAG: hypothetical protein D6789_00025 [Candidatus Woesearchaeota archaeon]
MARQPLKEQDPEQSSSRAGLFFLVGFALFLVLIFFLVPLVQRALAARALEQQREANRYNGFTFEQLHDGGLEYWQTDLTVNGQPYTIQFHYHPRDVETILLEEGITDQLITQRPRALYLSLPPNAPSTLVLAGVEISKITGDRNGENGILRIPTRGVLHEPVESGAPFPVLTCANATSQAVIIFFENGTQNRVYRDENPNCIRLEYVSPEDAVRVADRFSYDLLQII